MTVDTLPVSSGSQTSSAFGTITRSFTRSADVWDCGRSALTKFATGAGPRSRSRIIPSHARFASISAELSGNHFVPFCVTADGRMWGYDNSNRNRAYWTLNGTSYTRVDLPSYATTFLAAGNRAFAICTDYKVYAMSATESPTAVTLSGAPQLISTSVNSWPGDFYDSANDLLMLGTYDAGHKTAYTQTGTSGTGPTTIAIGAASFVTTWLSNCPTLSVKFVTSGNSYTVTAFPDTSHVTVSGNASAETGQFYIMGLKDELYRLPGASSGAIGSLTATRVMQYGVGSNDVNNSHLHLVFYNRFNGNWYVEGGDAYAYQLSYVSTDGGRTFVALTPSGKSPGCQIISTLAADASGVYAGFDFAHGIGRADVVTPFRQGTLLERDLRNDGTYPTPGTCLQLVKRLLSINGLILGVTEAGGSATPLGLVLYDPVTGDAVRYWDGAFADTIGAVMVFQGKLHGALNSTHVTWALPRVTRVSSVPIACKQTNIAPLTVADASDSTKWTSPSGLTVATDTGGGYASANGVKVSGTGLDPSLSYTVKLASTFTVVNATPYVVQVWVKVRKASGFMWLKTPASDGNGPEHGIEYDSTKWHCLRSLVYTTSSTSLDIGIVTACDRISNDIDFTIGGVSVVRVDGTYPLATNRGYSGDWSTGYNGSAYVESGYEGLYVSTGAQPRAAAAVMLFRCDENYFNYGAAGKHVVMAFDVKTLVYFDSSTGDWYIAKDDGTGAPTGAVALTGAGTRAALYPRAGRVFALSVSYERNTQTSNPTVIVARLATQNELSSGVHSASAYLTNSSTTLFNYISVGSSQADLSNPGVYTPPPGFEVLSLGLCDFVPGSADLQAALDSGGVAGMSAKRGTAVLYIPTGAE